MADAALTPELALRYLDELSTDIRAAVVLDPGGSVLAHSPSAQDDAGELARLAGKLFEQAEAAAPGGPAITEVEVQRGDGGVFAVRSQRFIVAVVAGRFALSSLMLYDLRNVLQDLEPKAA